MRLVSGKQICLTPFGFAQLAYKRDLKTNVHWIETLALFRECLFVTTDEYNKFIDKMPERVAVWYISKITICIKMNYLVLL